jgi:putative ATP-binding cassette transporter
MRILSFLYRYSRGRLVLAIACGIVSGAFNTLLLTVINAALNGEPSPVPHLGWVFASLCVLLPLTRFASETLVAHLGQGAMLEFRMRVCREIIATPLARLEQLGAHRLLAMLIDDVPNITNAVSIVPIIAIYTAVVTGVLIYLAVLSWLVFFAVIGFAALGIFIYQFPVLEASRLFRSVREHADILVKHFKAVTDGAKEMKLNARRREAFFSKVLHPAGMSYRKQNLRGMFIYAAANSCGQGLVFAVVGLTIFVLPAYRDISLSTLTAYTLIILYLASAMQAMMNFLPTLSRANVAIKRLQTLERTLELHATENYSINRADPDAFWDSLELDGITHAYRGEEEVDSFRVGPINLTVRPGELIFLAGGNGSGKTTLAKLITGLYKPESGEIRLSGRPVTDLSRDRYRQLFSVIFSDFFLFDSLLGIEHPKIDEQARRLLVKFQLDRKVEVKDARLSTTNLSSGQRKRLALLTAYLEDRSIYIFDEWAADQDPLFRHILYHEILPGLKARGKTVIAITHDESYYYLADRVIKMNNGQVEYDRYNLPEPVPALAALTASDG